MKWVEPKALLPELNNTLQVIAEMCPVSAMHAGHMLKILSQPWLASIEKGCLLPASLLTPSGYPVEFTFRTNSSDLVYTTELGMPQDSSEAKWEMIRELIGEFDSPLRPLLQTLIAQPEQRFGCWLGVRHRDTTHSFKVYQEVVPSASMDVLRYLYQAIPDLPEVAGLAPKLLGVVPEKPGVAEYYFQVKQPNMSILNKLYGAVGVGKLLPSVINYLSYLAGEPREKLLARLRIGMSYHIAPERMPCITLFVHASQIFADNRQARTRWLGFVNQLDRDVPIYEAVTQIFDKTNPTAVLHGLIGIGITETQQIETSIGLCPFSRESIS